MHLKNHITYFSSVVCYVAKPGSSFDMHLEYRPHEKKKTTHKYMELYLDQPTRTYHVKFTSHTMT